MVTTVKVKSHELSLALKFLDLWESKAISDRGQLKQCITCHFYRESKCCIASTTCINSQSRPLWLERVPVR